MVVRRSSTTEPWVDKVLLERFRLCHAQSFGLRSPIGGYKGLVDEAQKGLRFLSLLEFQRKIYATLLGFFTPTALLLYRGLARVAPSLAIWVFVKTTPVAFRFLVGEMEQTQPAQLHIPRCNFLQQAGADVCIKACKVPTEAFFRKEVGVQLDLEPDHQNGSCSLCFIAQSKKP